MDATLLELNQKIDALTAQVGYLAEQARVAERAQADRAELMHDLAPIANSAMRIATEQLQEVESYVDLADLLRFVKKLVRQLPNLEKLLDQADSLTELLALAGPIGKDAFHMAESGLDGLDRKGYFKFARASGRIVDNVITSFSEDDVRKLGDNIVLILRTVKEMTQPEVMHFLRDTVQSAEREAAAPVNISYRALLGQMRDPNVRRGLALTLRMLSSVGGQPERTQSNS